MFDYSKSTLSAIYLSVTILTITWKPTSNQMVECDMDSVETLYGVGFNASFIGESSDLRMVTIPSVSQAHCVMSCSHDEFCQASEWYPYKKLECQHLYADGVIPREHYIMTKDNASVSYFPNPFIFVDGEVCVVVNPHPQYSSFGRDVNGYFNDGRYGKEGMITKIEAEETTADGLKAIRGIRFYFGGKPGLWRGGQQGGVTKTIVINEGEYINAVELIDQGEGKRLQGINFYTNNGRKLSIAGGSDIEFQNDRRQLAKPQSYYARLRWVSGYVGGYVDGLMFHYDHC